MIHSADCAVRSLQEEEDEEPIRAEVGLARERAFQKETGASLSKFDEDRQL